VLTRALTLLALVGLPGSAFAQVDAANAIDYAIPKKQRRSLPRTHDGVYFGFQVGPSYFSASSERENRNAAPDTGTREFSGPSLALRFAVGGTLANRVALGAMLGFEPVLSLTAKDENGVEFDTYGAKFSLRQQGVLLDYYFHPSGGFHVLGSVGFAQLGVTRTEIDRDTDDGEDPSGTYWMLGFGHEWWLGDEQSFGFLASLTDGSLEVTERGNDIDVNLFSLGLALTATIN